MSILLEICIDSIESAMAAKRGGADRLEVCSSLAVEGATPSYGLVKRCMEETRLPVMMMIRPHDGGFVYSDADIDVMLSDIEMGHTLGVDGFVFGVLNHERRVHIEQCQRLLAATGSREVTFHRAFDVVPDPIQAFDSILDLGFNRLLTSGQAANAQQGISLIRELTIRAKERISILPGVGIDSHNARAIIEATGVSELHTAASVASHSGQSGQEVSFGNHRNVASEEIVRAIRQAVA
ncbi:MAG: copper homeostasis protein CutC [Planctomycetota bacterium]